MLQKVQNAQYIMPPNQLSPSLCAVCVHLYAKMGPQPLCMSECVREVG